MKKPIKILKKPSQISLVFLLTLVSLIWIGCDDDVPNPDSPSDQFDRSEMLTHWVDGFIIPGYEFYLESIDSLHVTAERFVLNPNSTRLNDLRNNYRLAYNAWQEVSMFEIGKAEELVIFNCLPKMINKDFQRSTT